MKKAFTLIELLVVVLIIGILAAVALPQYRKAVEKAKATQGITMLKSIYQAAVVYYMANDAWPNKLEDLDVSSGWNKNIRWNTNSEARDTISNDDWSIHLIRNGGNTVYGVEMGRISGPYAGSGFTIYLKHQYDWVPDEKLLCVEKNRYGNFIFENKGKYCEDIFSATLVYGGEKVYTYMYQMP